MSDVLLGHVEIMSKIIPEMIKKGWKKYNRSYIKRTVDVEKKLLTKYKLKRMLKPIELDSTLDYTIVARFMKTNIVISDSVFDIALKDSTKMYALIEDVLKWCVKEGLKYIYEISFTKCAVYGMIPPEYTVIVKAAKKIAE